MMPRLNLPECDLKIKTVDQTVQVLDEVRRKFVKLSPEEWVRQNFTHYLIGLDYPKGLMAIEKSIQLNGMNRRCDIVLHHRNGRPFMIVECKAPDVNIDQRVFDQISRYNLSLQVDYLIVTNGMQHYAAVMDYEMGGYKFLREIPGYTQITEPLD